MSVISDFLLGFICGVVTVRVFATVMAWCEDRRDRDEGGDHD